jgi:hypothetical protein
VTHKPTLVRVRSRKGIVAYSGRCSCDRMAAWLEGDGVLEVVGRWVDMHRAHLSDAAHEL